MTLPPFLRALQQSYLVQLIIAGLVVGGGVTFACFKANNNMFSMDCVRDGLVSAAIYLFGSLQHSPNSASFNPDGTLNKAVALERTK